MFVVEMPGYPLDTRPTGRVKLLEDSDGDGRPDRSTLFADSLVLPTGVLCWKRGILVTAAPPKVPQPLLDQLKVGGKLVIPVGRYFQDLKVYTRTADGSYVSHPSAAAARSARARRSAARRYIARRPGGPDTAGRRPVWEDGNA